MQTREKPPETANAAPPFADDDRVMRDKETAERSGLSLKHFRRIRSEGAGPRTVRLGLRAVGTRVTDWRAWIAARVEGVSR